jgi:hypothetical protein
MKGLMCPWSHRHVADTHPVHIMQSKQLRTVKMRLTA